MTAPRLTFIPAPRSPWRPVADAPDATEKPPLEGDFETEKVNQNGFLVDFSQANLPRNEGHKKPGIVPGIIYNSCNRGAATRPVAKPNTPATEVLSHEFC